MANEGSVVFIHGIGRPEKGGADALRSAWIEALGGGVPKRTELLERATSLAFYRDWSWASSGAQSLAAGEPTAYMLDLARCWLEAAQESSDPSIAADVAKHLRAIDGLEQPGAQGPMRVIRGALAALANVPLFAEGGFAGLSQIQRFNLWQVDAYVNDRFDSKRQVLDRVAQALPSQHIDVLVSHSLGTVVAYEAIHRLDISVGLFVTAGSPLGLDRLVFPRLSPAATYPASAKRWLNIADPDDPIAADRRLARRFLDAGERLIDVEVHNAGRFAWHNATAYLKHPELREPIFTTLDGAAMP